MVDRCGFGSTYLQINILSGELTNRNYFKYFSFKVMFSKDYCGYNFFSFQDLPKNVCSYEDT